MCPECGKSIPAGRTIYCSAACRTKFRRRGHERRRIARRISEGEAWVPVRPDSIAYGKSEWRRFEQRND